ncbi:hypothetical protein O5559_28540, partial [Escherichia coli]|nr:hypothetical protein [Escherichia coli]
LRSNAWDLWQAEVGSSARAVTVFHGLGVDAYDRQTHYRKPVSTSRNSDERFAESAMPHGFEVAGGILPAVGFGLLLRVMF